MTTDAPRNLAQIFQAQFDDRIAVHELSRQMCCGHLYHIPDHDLFIGPAFAALAEQLGANDRQQEAMRRFPAPQLRVFKALLGELLPCPPPGPSPLPLPGPRPSPLSGPPGATHGGAGTPVQGADESVTVPRSRCTRFQIEEGASALRVEFPAEGEVVVTFVTPEMV